MNIAITAASGIGLGLLTALFSAAEGALLAISRADRESLKTDTRRSSMALSRLLETPKKFLFTLQVAAELSLVGCTLAIAALVIAVYGVSHGWFTLLIAPPLVLVLGLILPRAIATRYPRQISRMIALPLQGVYYLLFPLVWPLKRLSEVLMDVMGIAAPGSYRLEESEFKTLVDIGQKEGTLREQERELIHNVFEFGDIVVSEVMTPRTDIVGFPVNTPVEKMLEAIKDQRFARVPIYKSNLDNILGILYTKDLLALRIRSETGRRTVKELLHPVYFVPVTKKVDELFREFQTQKIHMAVVVDEYGGVAGIVSMDDLLAELFGVMLDEHDTEEHEFIQMADGSWRIQAQMDIEQFCEMLGIELSDQEEEVNTVGGLVLGLFGALPRVGDAVRHGQFEFRVEKLEGTRLQEVLVRQLPPDPEPTATGLQEV